MEALFAEPKNYIGLRRLRLRRMELRARAVLPGGNSAEPETGAIPQGQANSADGKGMKLV
jgi:hypothetical protein